jgi:Holliday junction resolvase RusA-like endonuclease
MSGDRIEFAVRGVEPESQGSMTFYGKGRVSHGRPAHDRALRAWRGALEAEARVALAGREPLEGPVGVEATFWLLRPQAHHAGRKRSHPVRSDAPAYSSTKPDLDKLLRAAIDGIAPALLRDDGQVAQVGGEKRYADEPEAVGAQIAVWPLADTGPPPLSASAGPAPGRLYVQASGPGGASP